MLAAFLGGWEIVIILAIVLLLLLGFVVAVSVIAIVLWRQQKKGQLPAQPSSQVRTG
jgi:hypothetical protein